jgi:hypothetical protein
MTLGPLFLSEDAALKELLKGIVVTDQRANAEGENRPVKVWFGMPDQELRDQTYPYITIDMIDVAEDRARATRGFLDGTYDSAYLRPSNATAGLKIDTPIPIYIDYQITTYARNPRHDRQILSDLLFTRLPLRFGALLPADDTVRRLDVLDVAKRDTVEQAKRLFINAITVRVSSEMPLTQYKELYKVQTVITSGPPLLRRGGEFVGVDRFTITQQTGQN